jgi:hypothetical protein
LKKITKKNANSLQAGRKMSELPYYLSLPNTGAAMLILRNKIKL